MTFRLVIADDLEDSAESLGMLMRHAGHEVETAYDGEAAWKLAESRRPDVMLLDIGMPKLNGYEVAAKIREQPWGRGIILVALTGWSREESGGRVEQAGFDLQMVKPIDHQVLGQVLNQLAAERESPLTERREPPSP